MIPPMTCQKTKVKRKNDLYMNYHYFRKKKKSNSRDIIKINSSEQWIISHSPIININENKQQIYSFFLHYKKGPSRKLFLRHSHRRIVSRHFAEGKKKKSYYRLLKELLNSLENFSSRPLISEASSALG